MKIKWRKVLTHCSMAIFCIAVLYTINVFSIGAVVRTADRGYNVPATWNEGDAKITLPEAPEGWTIELFGSDRKEVVAIDGTVTRPLQDVSINLLYKLTNTTTNEVIETNVNTQISITKQIPTQFVSGANVKPDVLPVLREWVGGEGKIKIQSGTRILVDSANYRQSDATHQKENLEKTDNFYTQVNSFKKDLKDLMGIDAPIVIDGTPVAGDIYFTAQNAPTTLGKEGYQIEFGEIGTDKNVIIVRAPQKTGALYGGISILQILKQNDGELPRGITRDYPEFEKRGYMLDVARTFLPVEYLDNTMKQMAWYKLNMFSLHLSDNDIWNNLTLGEELYAAFRLESDVEGLTAKDGYYTKDEFREMQYDGNDLGIAVIPELDTPGHALAYTRVWPDISRGDGGKYLDVKNPETAKRIMKLFDEYTLSENGKEEVFILPEVNIGTDEYKNGDREAFRKYTDTLLKHIKASGKDPVFWGSLTENSGSTPVMTDATMFAWYKGYANPKDSLEAGYNIISMEDQEVYIVPGGGYYGNQYGRGEYLYNSWVPNRNNGWSSSPAPEGHPRVSGGQFAVWNDWVGNGISTGDISFRVQYNMQAIAQKSWAGNENKGSYADFKALGQRLGDAPNADFLYTEEKYENNEVVNLKNMDDIASNSGAKLDSQNIVNDTGRFDNGIRFNGGNSCITTDLESTGFDWTAAMWIKPDSDNPENTVLMEGKTGTLKLKQGKTNKLGYSVDRLFDEDGNPTVDKFNHYFDYEIQNNQWTHITLSGDAYGVRLYVNGLFVDELKDKKWPNYNANSGQNSMSGIPHYYQTLMLPTATIGSKTNAFKGVIDDLQIYNRVLTESEVSALPKIPGIEVPKNLAVNATVTASGSEVDYKWQPATVTDGNRSGDSRWSSNYDDAAWLTVDLGSIQPISQVDVYWEAAFAIRYKMLISTDGNDWKEILDVPAGGDGGSPKRIVFDQTDARYVKFQGIERKVISGQKWGYSMYEIEIFETPTDSLKPGLVKLLTDSSILYNSSLIYLDEGLKTSYKDLLDEVNNAILGDLTNGQIEQYTTRLTTESAKLTEIKKAKEAMTKARDDLKTYVNEPNNKKRITQETLDRIVLLLDNVEDNLINKDNIDATNSLTADLINVLQIATDEVTNANVAKNATVTTNAELWPGFTTDNLIDGNLNTRLAYKRTASPITLDIALSNTQKTKPWNQLILHEVIGTIEGGEVVNAEIVAYDVQVKQADGTYVSVQKVDRSTDNLVVCGPSLSIELDRKITTEAIRLIVTPKSASAGLNISELEIFNEKNPEEDDTTIRGILHGLQMPTIGETDVIGLPTVPSDYNVRIIQSSQPTIISHKGQLTLPQIETNVSLVVEVSKTTNGKVVERATLPYVVQVPVGATAIQKAELQALIDEAKTLIEKDYSTNSWTTLQNTITEAETLMSKTNIFATSIVSNKKVLLEAKNGLVNISELQRRVDDFAKLDENDYLTVSYRAYKALLLEKQVLLSKEDVTTQEILEACQDLDALGIIAKGNPKELQDLINGYKDDSTLITDNFTKISWQAYNTAFINAEELLSDGQYTQEQLSEKQTLLLKAYTNLVSLIEAEATIKEYGDKDILGFTPKTQKEYKDAIDALCQLASKEDASKTELAEAIINVLEANSKLVEKADMKTLKELVDSCKVYIDNKDMYIKSEYDNFYKAYKVIIPMLDDENLSKVDAENAMKSLQNTIKELKKIIVLEKDGVIIDTDEGAIPDGTQLTINEVSEKLSASVKKTLSSIGKKVQIFDLSLTLDGKNVTLQKSVKVKLLIPDGYNQSKLGLYYVNGSHKEELLFTIEDGYIVFATNHFSIYTIVEKEDKGGTNPGTSIDPTDPSKSTPNKPGGVSTGDESNLGLYSLCLMGTVCTVVLLKKRKENDSH